MFGYFKPSVSTNVEYDIPLGMSIYANAMDTLAALDVAFDSLPQAQEQLLQLLLAVRPLPPVHLR